MTLEASIKHIIASEKTEIQLLTKVDGSCAEIVKTVRMSFVEKLQDAIAGQDQNAEEP